MTEVVTTMLICKEQGVPQSVRACRRAYDGAGATTKILQIMENVKGCYVITNRVKLKFLLVDERWEFSSPE